MSNSRLRNAVLYVAKAGCPWRSLPQEFPAWPTVYQVFRKWAESASGRASTTDFAPGAGPGRQARTTNGRHPGPPEREIRPPAEPAVMMRPSRSKAANATYWWTRLAGQGLDKLVIFADRDGDGKFETRKVLVEGLNLVSGFEVGDGGVLVGAAPELLFIPNGNHDDAPDGPPGGA